MFRQQCHQRSRTEQSGKRHLSIVSVFDALPNLSKVNHNKRHKVRKFSDFTFRRIIRGYLPRVIRWSQIWSSKSFQWAIEGLHVHFRLCFCEAPEIHSFVFYFRRAPWFLTLMITILRRKIEELSFWRNTKRIPLGLEWTKNL